MRISPVYSINFGYNKKLSQRLNDRLNNSKQTPTIELIGEMNSTCNSVESMIVQLESPNSGGVDRNEEQINILLSYFFDNKKNSLSFSRKNFSRFKFFKENN